MNPITGKKLMALQEAFWKNPEFQALSREHETYNRRFLEVTGQLSSDSQAAIFDYIGLLVEIHLKTLEYAVSGQ